MSNELTLSRLNLKVETYRTLCNTKDDERCTMPMWLMGTLVSLVGWVTS